jgi:SAM-dependent methyltransferase
MNETGIAAQVLCCPDCGADLSAALRCQQCGRSLTPGEGGIIGALPAAMAAECAAKSELQRIIDAAAPEGRAGKIVLYEKAFHDEQAAYYDKLFADPLPLRQYYKRLVDRDVYGLVRGREIVVDLCCGTGKSSLPLIERGVPVVGMDVSREMLRIYKRKCEEKGYRNVTLIQADASRPPLRRGSCGAIIMIGGLHHIPERAACVQRCWDALTSKGILIFHEPLKTGSSSKLGAAAENLYALTDPGRVWKALKRRIGWNPEKKAQELPAACGPDFTPYERPFTSSQELVDLMPGQAEALALRSQGVLSFREFAPYLQGRSGVPLAAFIVRLDEWLAKRSRARGCGDALFAVFRKTAID